MAATATELNNVFGSGNIQAWADIDNDGNTTTISNRIAYALQLATAEVSAKLRLSPYVVADALDHVLVEHAVCQRAADYLYSPRAVSDEDPSKDLMAWHRKEYEKFFKSLAAGQLDLGLTRASRPYPKVVKDEVQSSDVAGY